MRVKHRFVFNSDNTKLIKLLDRYNVAYAPGETLTILELFEDDPHYYEILKFLTAHGIRQTLWEAVYSQNEIDAAQWLSCRSTWRYGYPQPDQENKGYRFSTYDITNYCEQCGKGLVQKENFILKKEPNWGARNFLMINWVHDELFVSSKAESILKEAGLTGFRFCDVSTRTGDKMPGIKQLYIENYIDNGLSNESVQNELICSRCGYKRIMQKPGYIYYHKKCFENVSYDIVKSQEKFGEITCASLIIISREFYSILKENKVDRGLAFEPVILV